MDIEKTIHFLLEQDARHAVAVQQHDERIAELDERLARTEGMIRQLVEVGMSLAHHGEETDRRMAETDRLIKELRHAQAHSDGRLDALVDIVDKIVRRNGGAALS